MIVNSGDKWIQQIAQPNPTILFDQMCTAEMIAKVKWSLYTYCLFSVAPLSGEKQWLSVFNAI